MKTTKAIGSRHYSHCFALLFGTEMPGCQQNGSLWIFESFGSEFTRIGNLRNSRNRVNYVFCAGCWRYLTDLQHSAWVRAPTSQPRVCRSRRHKSPSPRVLLVGRARRCTKSHPRQWVDAFKSFLHESTQSKIWESPTRQCGDGSSLHCWRSSRWKPKQSRRKANE